MTLGVYFAAIAVLLMVAAFFSSAETAYMSANRIRLENVMETGSRSAKVACYILDRYDDALSTILIGNNMANMAASSIATLIAIHLAGGDGRYTVVSTFVITVLIIIFSETIPKMTAKKNANQRAMQTAYILRALMFALKPAVLLIVYLVRLITSPLKSGRKDDENAAVEELESIIDTVEVENVIDGDRSELLHAALDFYETSAREVMTARVDMEVIDIDDDWETILEIADTSPYSRVPVYEDSIDDIIGFLSLNHFFKALTDTDEKIDIRPLLIEPCYVYKTLKLPDVLSELRRKKTHIAIVTDDYGGTMGLLTMEDVLEQIVGEIWDETDEVTDEVVLRSDDLFEIDGDMSIADFLELLDRDEDGFESESETVGGWTLEEFSAFPQVGDSFESQGLYVTVLEMDGLRVEKVLVKVNKKD